MDSFLARAPGVKSPERIELRLDQFKREYEARDGRAFLWASKPGIYYFVDGKGGVAFVGKSTDAPEHDEGLACRMYLHWVPGSSDARNATPERWALLLRDSEAIVGAYAFDPCDWYWPLALEQFLICELEPRPYLCEPPAARPRGEAGPSAAKRSPARLETVAPAVTELREQLGSRIQGEVVVMGLGNPCRGDDAAGGLVARQIRDAPGVYAIDAQDVPENHWRQVVNQRPDTIIMVGSINLYSPPGSVVLLDKHRIAASWPSTYRMPINALMGYFERETHARIFLIGIQPRQTDFMQSVSPEVQASIAGVADVLNGLLAAARRPAGALSRGAAA